MKYIPQGPGDQKQLLDAIGLKSLDDLFNYIPSQLRLAPDALKIPRAQSEQEIRETFQKIANLSAAPSVSFAGAGVYTHYVPSIVPFIQGRSEFSTAYTPYQPEISQGLLQAIFEYQTIVCELLESELSNASVYDGSTALAEGVLMALRLKKKGNGSILVAGTLHPHYREVLQTYCTNFADRLVELPVLDNRIDLTALTSKLSGNVDVLVTQSPNIFGTIEDYAKIGSMIRGKDVYWVTSTMEPVCFGVLRGPGGYGAHIVTADGQSFGNSPYMGGASFGLFATKNEYIRNLPGRLVGETVDQKNRRSYTLTFATREQFIRREKATSNICTNQNLNMIAGLIHLCTLGKEGIRELAVQNLSLTEHLKSRIRKETKCTIGTAPTFNEFTVELSGNAATAVKTAADAGWVAGVDLGRLNPLWNKKLLIHVNETHKKEDFDRVVHLLQKI